MEQTVLEITLKIKWHELLPEIAKMTYMFDDIYWSLEEDERAIIQFGMVPHHAHEKFRDWITKMIMENQNEYHKGLIEEGCVLQLSRESKQEIEKEIGKFFHLQLMNASKRNGRQIQV